MKKGICGISGMLAAIAAIIILLITSFEIAIYSDFGWYEKEYEKYNVCADLEMEMEDVMYVTTEMMGYLRGNRGDLVVDTVVKGQEREFFNVREKSHMTDVQNMFLGGLNLRRGAIIVLLAAIIVLLAMKESWKRILPKSFLVGTVGFIVVTGGLGALFASDFNKYFTLFHQIFFDNDLWLLDPETDLMIRMLPEGFFFDMVIRIGIIFIVMMVIFLTVNIIFIKKQKNKSDL